MKAKDLYYLVPKKMYLAIALARIYLSTFNVWVSFVIQETLNISLGMSNRGIFYFKILSVLLIVSSVLYGFIFYYYKVKIEKIRMTLSQEIGHELMSKIVDDKYKVNAKDVESGKITNILTNDMLIVSNFFTNGIFPLIEMGLTILLGLIYLFVFSWKFAVSYLILGVIFYYINNEHNKKLSSYYDEYLAEDDKQKNFINEIFESAPIFSIFNLKAWTENKYENVFKIRKDVYSKYAKVLADNKALMLIIINFVQLLLLFLGFFLVSRGNMLMGTMIGLWNAGAGSILFSFSDIPNIISYLSKNKASLNRINKILETSTYETSQETRSIIKSDYNKILVNHLFFQYEDQIVFNGIAFEINGRGMTYITGNSGSGKTTLFNLLAGEIQPTSGNIIFFRTDNDKQNNLFAFVPPNGGVFNISLYENATLLSKKQIEKKYVKKLFKKIGLEKYNDKIDKVVGNEIDLSLGEIKRLSIIRALLSDRDYLLLDEPFADIDKKSQFLVMKLLREYSKYKSVVVITHTFNFIEENEKIINLD